MCAVGATATRSSVASYDGEGGRLVVLASCGSTAAPRQVGEHHVLEGQVVDAPGRVHDHALHAHDRTGLACGAGHGQDVVIPFQHGQLVRCEGHPLVGGQQVL